MLDFTGLLSRILIVCICFWGQVAASQEDYRLQPGDELTISLIGLATDEISATVQTNGRVVFPHFGAFHAAGRLLEELQRDIGLESIGKVILFYSPVGEKFEVALTGDDVFLNISRHRPVYVTGDVERNGAVEFFPGITVRMAVADAGGATLLGAITENEIRRLPPLKSELETLAIDHAAAIVEVWKTDAGLKGQASLAFPPPATVFVEEKTFREMLNDAREEVSQILLTRDSNQLHLNTRFEALNERIELLSLALQNQQTALSIEEEELSRLTELESRGLTARAGVSNARQSLLSVASRVLDVQGRLAQLTLERDELRQQIDIFELEYVQPLLQQRASLLPRVWSLESRIASAQELLSLGGLELTERLNSTGAIFEFIIVRRIENATMELVASPDDLLFPGDVIDVSVQYPAWAPPHPFRKRSQAE